MNNESLPLFSTSSNWESEFTFGLLTLVQGFRQGQPPREEQQLSMLE
ncbi:hypothetical protein ACFPYJ_22380 [Paenibacillus solisilvae]|uniref:Uncharacterized protein n=1 Tax=Paenibacillus solisilvae TaxID=2486751 RepID=A0ABW0W1R3_9BACL